MKHKFSGHDIKWDHYRTPRTCEGFRADHTSEIIAVRSVFACAVVFMLFISIIAIVYSII